MIIGRGLIATALEAYDSKDKVFIAAGVSDSKCAEAEAYRREELLVRSVLQEHGDKKIIFFSTYSINDPAMAENMYVKNKMTLEKLVKEEAPSHFIIRISNLVGNGGNPNNIFNFLVRKIEEGVAFTLWPESRRNLITVDDFAFLLNKLVTEKEEVCMNRTSNIINSRDYTALEIVEAIERHLGKRAVYDIKDVKSAAVTNPTDEANWFKKYGLECGNYLKKILDQYYCRQPQLIQNTKQ